MAFVFNGFPSKVITDTNRVRVQSTTTAQDAVINGLVYTTKWREDAITSGSSVFAEFTIPVGMAMSLTKRVINTSGNSFKFRAYPDGAYVADTAKTDTGDSFAKTRNNRQDGTETQNLIRTTVTGTPTLTSAITYEDVFGAEGAGNRSSGSLASENSFLILTGDSFLLELHNGGDSTTPAAVELEYLLYPIELLPTLD